MLLHSITDLMRKFVKWSRHTKRKAALCSDQQHLLVAKCKAQNALDLLEPAKHKMSSHITFGWI